MGVLSWRWDCEETDQVWNSCADIDIELTDTCATELQEVKSLLAALVEMSILSQRIVSTSSCRFFDFFNDIETLIFDFPLKVSVYKITLLTRQALVTFMIFAQPYCEGRI